ncbi:hypothetical protein L484_006697 [Morus notabilis]|uniref:Uncharacterized protein n=1 Tax=Morus notabilis TaxID=981085 RepID=W9SLJ5_9ROSA|nr:hypothetical protein L484_006697 [Morus notabilis]
MTQTTASAPGGLNSLAGNGTEQRLTPAIVNSFRVSGAMERLTTITGPGQLIDQREFYGLCVSLSRGIDYAVANKERPTTARDLPKLMKQICDRELDAPLLCATMVLLISMKNACKVGWFPEKEAEELLTLSNEMGRHFCVPIVADTVTSCSHSVVATVMARFYPCMKMGHVFTSLEIKPGYGVYTNDFHILKESTYSPEDKICLLVVQVDKTDTSACIISPQQANFLINGKGVDRRTNVSMDPGPLMPTNVTPLLKYGTNLLQAVGQFNGHYVIVVAFMSETPLSETQVLPDYVQPLVDGSDSESVAHRKHHTFSLDSGHLVRSQATTFSIIKEDGRSLADAFKSFFNMSSHKKAEKEEVGLRKGCHSDGDACGGLLEVAKETLDQSFLKFAKIKIRGFREGLMPPVLEVPCQGSSSQMEEYTTRAGGNYEVRGDENLGIRLVVQGRKYGEDVITGGNMVENPVSGIRGDEDEEAKDISKLESSLSWIPHAKKAVEAVPCVPKNSPHVANHIDEPALLKEFCGSRETIVEEYLLGFEVHHMPLPP